jgi:ankyrin repeat protein
MGNEVSGPCDFCAATKMYATEAAPDAPPTPKPPQPRHQVKRAFEQDVIPMLHAASARGHHQVIEMLISKHGANLDVNSPDGNGNTALHLAAKSGSMECCKLLVKVSSHLLRMCTCTHVSSVRFVCVYDTFILRLPGRTIFFHAFSHLEFSQGISR